MISIKKRFAIALVLLLGTSVLILNKQKTDIHISGVRNAYLIPDYYLNNSRSAIYPGRYSGDKGKALSLFIPGDDRLAPQNGTDVSLLIFYDKRYGPTDSLLPLARAFIRESAFMGAEGEYFEYLKEWQGGRTRYLTTFNPTDRNELSDDDHVIEIQLLDDVEIGAVRKKSIPLCLMHSVADGFAMQLSLSGVLCNTEDVRHLKDYQNDLLMGWLVKEASINKTKQ